MEISQVNAVTEAALSFESLKMQIASTNIAFANQVASNPNAVFQPLSIKLNGVEKLNGQFSDFSTFLQAVSENLNAQAVSEQKVKLVHAPDNPNADESGYVYKPDVNMVNEMLTLNMATRAYEANIRAYNSMKEMNQKALQIGK